MQNRYAVALAAALSIVSVGAQQPAPRPAADSVDARAARIHKEAIVVDTHIDTTLMLDKPGWDFMVRHVPGPEPDENHVDLPRLREGGLDAAFFSIYMAGTVTGPEAVKRALILIDHVRSLVEQHPNELVLATTAAEVRAAHRAGKFAALMGMEGGHMIDDSLAVLRDYHRARRPLPDAVAQRQHQLGRFVRRQAGAQRPDRVRQGRRPRAEPPRRDGRHLARRRQDVLGRARDQQGAADRVAFVVRAIAGHARNMTDDMLRALGAKGGVVMINYLGPGFLSNERLSRRERRTERPARRELPRVPCVGEDRRAHRPRGEAGRRRPMSASARISTARRCRDGMEDVSKLPKITAALLAKGYSEQDVKNILGENILRLLERVDAVGKELRATRGASQ